ncbi:MAG: adenylosuccinate synthetase [Saprospiraceae bacterium]
MLHTIPSGIFREHLLNVIGNGVVIDPITLEREIQSLDVANVNYQGDCWLLKKPT